MKKIELLAPAGDFDKLKTAIHFGADAVYLAGEAYGLRKASRNFSLEEIKEAVAFSHARNCKVHVTLNIIAHNEDLQGLEEYLKKLEEFEVDGLIIADPGIYHLARELVPGIPIHLSTQASTANIQSVKFWKSLGAKRIVLAREMSLEDIREIKQEVPGIEIETFAHGAMCISYSGRCLLSNYMTNRDANRGNCSQACRWKYHLVEEKRPGEYFPIEENENGSFIFNSKDLCMIDRLDDLIESGVDSIKIEGRVKTQYYVATVVRAYRLAIDAYYQGQYSEDLKNYLLDEIKKASYRDFTHGFYYDQPDEEAQLYSSSAYIRTYDFIAEVLDYDKESGLATVQQRNRFFPGETVEVFGPDAGFISMKLGTLYDEKMQVREVANVAQEIIRFKSEHELKAHDLIRRRSGSSNC